MPNNSKRTMTNASSMSSSMSSSLSFGKGKHGMALAILVIMVIVLYLSYYYMYKTNHNEPEPEHFESSNDSKSSTPNLTVSQGECIVAMFYAPWCGHCKTFKPEFEKATSAMNGKMSKGDKTKGKKVRFEKVNCDDNVELGKKYSISGYPTVKILNDDGTDIEYNGDRTFDGLKKYLVIDN